MIARLPQSEGEDAAGQWRATSVRHARQINVSVQAAAACALFVTHQKFARTVVGCIFRKSE